MAKRSVAQEVLDLLASMGIEGTVKRDHKHAVLEFYVDQKRVVYTVPKTPGDKRTVLNCIAGVKRLVRSKAR